jgi:hypothetical protein
MVQFTLLFTVGVEIRRGSVNWSSSRLDSYESNSGVVFGGECSPLLHLAQFNCLALALRAFAACEYGRKSINFICFSVDWPLVRCFAGRAAAADW